MADVTLLNGQYSIGRDVAGGDGSAVVYGYGTTVQVSNTTVDTGSISTQDAAVTGHDGQLFGVDTQPGLAITQTGQCYVGANGRSAMDAYASFAAKWTQPLVRLTPGAVQILRGWYPGMASPRRAYGRGRKIAPSHGLANQGVVPFTAMFQAADSLWYSDAESSLTLTTAPSFLGTLAFPVTPPFAWAAQANFQQNTAVNSGPEPTWPVITFTGPSNGQLITPSLTYVNTPVSVGYSGSLKPGDSLVIDTRPWARTALLNGASVAGLLTGNPMITLQLQPGSTLMKLGGTDYTGTATCVIRWRTASQAIGGTV